MRRVSTAFALALSVVLLVSFLSAQQTPTTAVPSLIRYSGTLKDVQDKASVPATTVGVTFAIYNQQDGGAAVWQETQNVSIDANGQYNVVLGSTTATGLPGDLFSQQEQRWLGVQVEGQAEQPRVLMVSVPYAFKAHEAETLGGKSVSDFVLANSSNSATNGSSTTGLASASAANNPSAAAVGTKKGAASDGPTNFSGSTTDQIVGVTQSGTGWAVNASAGTDGIAGTATAASGTALGVEGVAASTSGYGVYGNATSATGSSIGVKGNSSSASGTGVRGTATASSGSTTGVSAYVASAAGIAGVFNNAAGGEILSGQNNGSEVFAVDSIGNVNSVAGSFQIGGNNVVSINHNSLFLGVGAGAHTTGTANAFCGYQAGATNTTGANNTFSGYQAGFSNTIGTSNTFSGLDVGYANQSGSYNTFAGDNAGFSSTTGSYNTFTGHKVGYSNTVGQKNTFSGLLAGFSNTTGSDNLFDGENAGYRNTTGSDDVYIANQGPTSGTESNTIRIGTQGTGEAQQNAAYIAGIYGSTTNGGSAVFVDSTGMLGTGGGGGLVTSFNGRTGAVLPVATDYGTDYIQNGTAQQASANFNISGNGTLGGALSATFVNAATSYNISGSTVLSISSSSLLLGIGAGSNTTGIDNTFFGNNAGNGNTTGAANVFSGDSAGFSNVGGSYNAFYGHKAGYSNTAGQNNTFAGLYAGYSNTTGSDNVFYGQNAGYGNTTGSNDVYVANSGPSSGTESNTIRIGTQGTGAGQQNAAYIAGIFGSTSSSGVPVFVNSSGLLGTLTSSMRFKEQINDMGDSTSALMKLRPVTFFYKPEYDKGERTLQYGLLAEEVAQVYPELVAYDNDGQPYTVRYQYLASMLLNEVQKQYRRAQEAATVIQAQQKEIESLKGELQMQNADLLERLSRLEKLVGNQAQTIALK
ncbi:MAG: tail fiber domain-containing protein [Candidatus Korobacteraceae bacterium]|jgi:hypothetical protein